MSADGFIDSGFVRRLEPEHRRTHQKVRRNSRPRGRCESTWWAPFDPKTKAAMMQAAEFYGRRVKPFGKVAPKGQAMAGNAVAVLRELIRMIDYKTGRLEPSIATLAARVRLARDTVVRALKTLKSWGFVDWIRRYVVTGLDGIRGPQVEQTSNAYRLVIPPAAAKLLGKAAGPAPTPEDIEAADAEQAAQRRQYRLDDPTDPLGRALRALDPSRRKRDTGDQAQSGPDQE